jgi:4'-phosphopantetheinyl transferase EntD
MRRVLRRRGEQGLIRVNVQTLDEVWAAAATGAVYSPRIAALFPMPVAAAEIAGRCEPATRRWRDFTAGREAARHALARLGIASAALLPQAEGGPRWPDGIAGSISHAENLCGAVACCAAPGFSLGLDIERLAPLDAEVLAEIATPAERRWLESLTPAQAAPLAMALFSAKEAFYKCQHPLSGRWLEFGDVSLRLHADGRIEPAAVPPGLDPARYRGRYRIEAEHVLTGFWTLD